MKVSIVDAQTEPAKNKPTKRSPLSEPLRKVFTGVALFVGICFFAVLGYMAAGWEVEDSIYMVVITIFGVGYGEVQPVQSHGLRALTILVIVSGYAAVIYTVGGFMQMLIDGEINKALGARKMTREIESLRGHTVICGVGRMGTILARELRAAGKPYVVVDSDQRRLELVVEQGGLIVVGDATEEFTLENAGIRNASVLATVLSDDATNVFVTITARAMNPELMIIARGENPRTESKLLGCGANKVVLPTAIGATKVAQLIIRPSADHMLDQLAAQRDMNEDLGHIGLRFDELEVAQDSPLIDKSLSEIDVSSNLGFLIVGIRGIAGGTTLNPPATTKLCKGDVVIVLAHSEEIPQLASRFSISKKAMMYRGVVVQG
jgi:voltage-gated potassium channel